MKPGEVSRYPLSSCPPFDQVRQPNLTFPQPRSAFEGKNKSAAGFHQLAWLIPNVAKYTNFAGGGIAFHIPLFILAIAKRALMTIQCASVFTGSGGGHPKSVACVVAYSRQERPVAEARNG